MPEKGPPVFLDYDQASLDAAYDQAAYAPNREQLIKRRIRATLNEKLGYEEFGRSSASHYPGDPCVKAGAGAGAWLAGRQVAEAVGSSSHLNSPLEEGEFELSVPGGNEPADCPLAFELGMLSLDNFGSHSLYPPHS